MAISDSFSRFKDSKTILTQEGDETYGLMARFDFLDRDKLTDDQIVKVIVDGSRAGKPDMISNDLYSTPIHYWVLLMFNGVQNPFGWPQNGLVIEAPARSVILSVL